MTEQKIECGTLHLSFSEETKARFDMNLPIPIHIRAARDGDPVHVWATARGSCYSDKDFARKAAFMDTDEYRDRSKRSSEARTLVKAEALTTEIYLARSPHGWIVLDYIDSYATLDDFENGLLEAENPAWAFGCTETVGIDLDLEDWVQSWLDDNGPEDASPDESLTEFKPLLDAFDAWRKKQTITTYFPDQNVIVVLDPVRFAAERAEAEAYLLANPSPYPWECSEPARVDL